MKSRSYLYLIQSRLPISVLGPGRSARLSPTRQSRIYPTLQLSYDHRFPCALHLSHTITMADDTRQTSGQPKGAVQEDLSREALTVHPERKPFEGQQWTSVQNGKTMPYTPPENANMMPGGTQHTAGGEIPEINLYNALHVGQPITEIHKRPCVRDALMTGIGGGFATGGIRVIFGGTSNPCTFQTLRRTDDFSQPPSSKPATGPSGPSVLVRA